MSAIKRSTGTKSGSRTNTTSDEVGTKKARVLKHKQREEEEEEEEEGSEGLEVDSESEQEETGEKKERKPHRWRNGTLATMRINQQQKKNFGFAFARAPVSVF